jgi:glutathione S-transferase
MSDYKLTYFDFNGGRGEPIRIAFHAAGIELEDNRISFPEFSEMRRSARFNSVPVLYIDGAEVTQSNAISRYVGKLAGLYPEGSLQALYCDEVLGAVEDLNHYVVRTFGLKGEELQKAREQLADGWLSTYLKGFDKLLTRGGGEFFADGQLTIADLKVFVQVSSVTSGNLEHIPADLVQRLTPSLMEHQQRVKNHPTVAAYYNSRSS